MEIAILLLLMLVVLGIAAIGFWFWMLVECLSKEPSDGNDKVVWTLVIFFFNVLGALLYFFIRRPRRKQLHGH